MGVIAAVLSGFALALVAPWLHRRTQAFTGWVLALLPLGLFVYFGTLATAVLADAPITVSVPWVPSLGVDLAFHVDGLSLLFAFLICGIGALVLIYAGAYMAGEPQLGRFFAFLLAFLASMLGLVLADNVLILFVFWELTSISSYLLIGFDHRREAARAAALQALIVTVVGGLAMLAGLLLLGHAGGTFRISSLLGQGAAVQADPLYPAILLLVLAGAFTKSAQVPFHFWLPRAMEAPTPVSAYLHSATMVKAGVYLLARLSPTLAGTDLWIGLVSTVGAVTMLLGAYLALRATDLKQILAYSTVSVLGLLTHLLGLGTELAVGAAMVYLLSHALYKGALFLLAGIIDHETGTRHVRQLGGLRRAMPITALAAALAALSMAGIPPMFGFISKELLFEVGWGAEKAILITLMSVLAGIWLVAVAGVAGFGPFFGAPRDTPKKPHDPPASMWLGPILLAGAGLAAGLVPGPADRWILAPAVAAVRQAPAVLHLGLWHGFTEVLLLSLFTLTAGIALYVGRLRVAAAGEGFERLAQRWGPAAAYERAVGGLLEVARVQSFALQSGYLRYYLLIVISTAVALVTVALMAGGGTRWPIDVADVRFHEAVVGLLILLAAVGAAVAQTGIAAVVSLGVVGFGVAVVFILFGAPDLAMTQFLIEALTVILFVLVFYHLPRFTGLSGRRGRLRDAVVAIGAGAMITTLMITAATWAEPSRVSPYFVEHSRPLAHGRNIVNVVLVDFRALDTLGEITVLAVAGIGVFALLKLRAGGPSASPRAAHFDWPRGEAISRRPVERPDGTEPEGA